jgi:predicted RNA binding protein YcfA (HicA-like mRNA interferase family)
MPTFGLKNLCNSLIGLGFEKRERGSHHIFTKQGSVEILNLQPKGELAKPYQVKQVRSLITTYGLLPKTNEEQGEEK